MASAAGSGAGSRAESLAPPCVLVVEDEVHLADGIQENLEAEGYTVEVRMDGRAGLQRWQEGGIDLLVLDVMLPHMDGFEVCARIREAGGQVPILFLTARTTPDDRVRGLALGGDDYLGKPFHLQEFLLRVKGMLRRQAWYAASPASAAEDDVCWLGGRRVNFKTYEVSSAGGQVDVLPQKEIMILKLLVERAGEVVSRDAILDHVWGYDVFPSSRTIDNFVVRLRRRFEEDPSEPRYIHTIRGVGYRLVPEALTQAEQSNRAGM